MNVLLTSCGLETPIIERVFLDMLPKSPSEIKAISPMTVLSLVSVPEA